MKESTINKYIEDNIHLVQKTATWLKMKGYYSNTDDLICAGYEGLFKAAKAYDETKGKFSTYAKMCIANAMRDDIRLLRNIFDSVDREKYKIYLLGTREKAWKTLDRIMLNADLTEREWYVISNRFGIDCEPRTTNELAAELGKTPQMVNVIKREALRKMRLTANS